MPLNETMEPSVIEAERVDFKETQRYPAKWLWSLSSIGILLLAAITFWPWVFQGVSLQNLDYSTLIALGFLLLIIAYFASSNLNLTLTHFGVTVRLRPWQLKPDLYPWENIAQVYIRKYDPIKEFGGWGLRASTKGNAVSLYGNTGLQLVFKRGDTLLIGTLQPESLSSAIQRLKPS